jgi:HK97 family phage major capsid protein
MAEMITQEALHASVSENKGQAHKRAVEGLQEKQVKGVSYSQAKERLLADLPSMVSKLNALRKGSKDRLPVDIGLAEFVQEAYGYAPTEVSLMANDGTERKILVPESFYAAIGVNPREHTIERLMTLGEIDAGYRWIIPELFREAVRLGLRKTPVYNNLIRSEEPVSQTKVTMPDIKMSAMTPKVVGEMETISTGTLSFGSKDVKINKYGIGFNISDEAVRYTTLNMVAIALEDAGVRLGLGLDALLIDTLINGDQTSGDDVAVIGVDNTTNGFVYKDLLRAWIRMSRLGKLPTAMLSNETPALDILLLPEFKGFAGDSRLGNLNLRTPVPQSQDYYVHGAMPNANYLMLVNRDMAAVKLNATGLLVENERVVSRQFDSFYITITTGFATLMRDARLVINKSVAFSGNGFPSWMDVDTEETTSILG